MKNDYTFKFNFTKEVIDKLQTFQKTLDKISLPISKMDEMANSIRELQNSFNPVLKLTKKISQLTIPKSYFKEIESIRKNLINLVNFSTQSGLTPQITKAVEEMRKASISFIEKTIEIKRALEQTTRESFVLGAEMIKRWQEKESKLRRKLKDDKVFLIPSFKDLPLLTVYGLFLKHEDKKAIEVYHDIFSVEKNTNYLLKQWCKLPHFQKRLPILKKALKAHLNKDFELSIPVLIAQFEGIFCEKAEIDKYSSTKDIDRLMKRDESWSKEDKEIFYEIVDKQIFKSLSEKNSNFVKEFKKLNHANRNLIQHGKDISYYKKPMYSTRVILLLDFLTLFVDGKSKKSNRDENEK